MSKSTPLSLFLYLIVAFALFTLGRYAVVEMGANGSWLIIGGVVIFYAIWWANYQRKKKNKK